MSSSTTKSILIIILISAGLYVYHQTMRCECIKRIDYSNVQLCDDLDRESLFAPIKPEEMEYIKRNWSNEITTEDIKLVDRFKISPNRDIDIWSQKIDENIHFGAIIQPTNFDSTKSYGLLLWADGLNQKNPSVNINNSTIKLLRRQFPSHFIAIPSFRGQALVLRPERYCSDGFFGDAFNGATDDALSLLQLAIEQYRINDKDICILGVSRGATVSLLMASKDNRITKVAAIAGPTDFFSHEMLLKFGKQYKYQFLSETRYIDSIRPRMIRSSPIHFIEEYNGDLLLYYGIKDPVVDISNLDRLRSILKDKPNVEFTTHGGGHEFHDWPRVIDWLKRD